MDDQTDQKPAEAKPPPEVKKPEGEKSFWTTLPGILAQLAVLIGAIAGLIVTLHSAGVIGSRATDTPTPTLTFTPSQTSTYTSIPSFTPTATFAPVLTSTSTHTPTLAPTLTHTPAPSPTLASTPTPVPAPKLELCARLLEDRIIVREGPDTSTNVRGRLPAEACLIFDQRLPDHSWVRVAQEQRDLANSAFAFGWVKSELLSESDEIVHLFPYFGEDAQNGYYCINTGSGLKVRECADIACRQTAILSWQECLRFDARVGDSSWLRIAVEQDEVTFSQLTGNWVSTENFSLVIREFLTFVILHDMTPYFELLPVASPPPTPQG